MNYFCNMESAEKILDYLRNTELTEVEVLDVYRRFLKRERNEGFEEGCEFTRGIFSKRRTYCEATRSKNFRLILEEIEDYINTNE